MTPPPPSDEALVARAQRGDPQAFGVLYERHRGGVERVCRRWLRDGHLVEDGVQETFARAWTALGQFSGGANVGGWLRTIAKNHCLDLLRAGARVQVTAEPEDLAALPAAASPAANGDCLDRLAVEAMLHNLGRRDAEMLVQRHVAEHSVGALATRWGLTQGSMDVALHRARMRARKIATAEGLRGLLPVGAFRRLVLALQRAGGRHPEFAGVMAGVCQVLIAVTLLSPPQASAVAAGHKTAVETGIQDPADDGERLRAAGATATGSSRPNAGVVPASSTVQPSATGNVAGSTPRQTAAQPEAPAPAPLVRFDAVSAPTGHRIDQTPGEGSPQEFGVDGRGMGVDQQVGVEIRGMEPTRPIADASCDVATTAEPVGYCTE